MVMVVVEEEDKGMKEKGERVVQMGKWRIQMRRWRQWRWVGLRRRRGTVWTFEEEKEVEMEHSNVKPNMVTHSLTLVLGK